MTVHNGLPQRPSLDAQVFRRRSVSERISVMRIKVTTSQDLRSVVRGAQAPENRLKFPWHSPLVCSDSQLFLFGYIGYIRRRRRLQEKGLRYDSYLWIRTTR